MKANIKKVKIAMARLCLSADGLSAKAKTPRATVAKVINGRNVRPDTLGKIAKALECDVTEILED